MNIRFLAACFLACLIIISFGSLTGAVFAQGGNGQINVDPTKPMTFSWVPYKETTKYRFVLAKDPGLTQIIVEADVAGTEYVYNGKLDYYTNYFWEVRGIDPPSDPSATFSFRTIAEPVPPTPVTPQTGISCAKAGAGSAAVTSDISPILLGAVLVGLVFVSRQKTGK